MTEEELNRKIGDRVSQMRKDCGLSQSDLAAMVDSEKQNISRLERGQVNSGAYFLYKIAVAMEVSLSELLEFEP